MDNYLEIYQATESPEIKSIPRTKYVVVEINVLAESKEALHAAITLDILSSSILKHLEKKFDIHYQAFPLEGVWHLLDNNIGFSMPENIEGKMMIKQPLELNQSLFEEIKNEVLQKNQDSNLIEYINSARLQLNEEEDVIQMLHIGSYTQESKTFAIMNTFAVTHKFSEKGEYHREIYLKDVRHTTTDKFETILRISNSSNVSY